MRRPLRAGLILVLGALTACAENAPYDTLDPVGPAARQIDELFMPVFWIAVVIFVLVEGAILLFALIFREKEGRRLPRQTHGNTALEILWTVVPALILVWVGYATLRTIFEIRAEAADAVTISVTGNQWWWEIEYPEHGVVTANEMHIPADQPVRVELTSTDVIHSFWVPRLAGKMDVVPGRTHVLTIEAPEPGVYLGQCVEFCGLSHALMRFRVIAQSDQDYRAWLESQQEPAAETVEEELAAAGQELFLNGQCATCHVIEGVNPLETPVGPDLTHFASRDWFAGAILENTPENVAAWLRNPPEVKPGSKMPNLALSQEDIQALVAYLETLE